LRDALTVNVLGGRIVVTMNDKPSIDNKSATESHIWRAISDWDLNEELESSLADSIQSTFDSLDQKALIYKGKHPELGLKQMCRHIARKPDDLPSHIKRFYLAMQTRSIAQVEGALVDIIIILRFHGKSLSERLIRESLPLLGQEKVEVFTSIVNDKTVNAVLNMDVSFSVLVNGNSLPATFKRKEVS